ncbi:MAG: glycosyltransferase [Gemmatimonadales bacterium]
MTIEPESNEPLLSAILATDTIERVERVIQSLAEQTVAKRIELILVIISRIDSSRQETIQRAFHSIRVIQVESIVPLSAARAKGVRVALAPFIFIAETHAYPDPSLAEKLIDALSGEWSLAVPGFRNANPHSGLSWAGFLSDYGAWSQNLEGGEIFRPPSHDAAFRRSVLLESGDRLEKALTFGSFMPQVRR